MRRGSFLVGSCTLWIVLSFAAVHAERPRIYIANDDHTDYLWSADEATYAEVFQSMLDYYLDLAEQTSGDSKAYQSRFNCDGSFWLWTYEKHRTPADFARLMKFVKSGHISAPLTPLVSCYGGAPAEAVLRGMYYNGRLERRFDHRFTLAVAMENQAFPLGLVSLWAGAGAKYSWRGVCGCASRMPGNLSKRPHEIYWAAGKDGQRILMKWHSLYNNKSIGGYAEAFDPVTAIEYLYSDGQFLSRYTDPSQSGPYQVRGAFGFGWDAVERKTGVEVAGFPRCDHFHEIARTESDKRRQVVVSNEHDFFTDFESNYGKTLPVESVTFGNEWDLYCASMAEVSARVKRAVSKLRAAEAMAVLVSQQEPEFIRGRDEERDLAYMNLGLYWEHDWTADGPVPRKVRAEWQERIAGQIESYVERLHADARSRLSKMVMQASAGSRFLAFNPLGWVRTDVADFPYSGSSDIHVRDLATGQEVPHQIINNASQTRLRILARKLPAVGYRVYEILDGAGNRPHDLAATTSADNTTIENDFVRVMVEPDGAIASFVVKDGNKELAATIGGLKLNDLAAGNAEGEPIVVENHGPVSVTLKCVSGAGKKHTTRITLYRDSERVDIRNEIRENFDQVLHWGFSFDLVSPDVHVEEVGAVIRAKEKAHGGDYSDSLARFDYLSLNHFADIAAGEHGHGVTLSNADCYFARLGDSTPGHLDTNTPQLRVLAGGQVDGPKLGIPQQNGATHFLQRFALRPHTGYSQTAAMQFAMEHQNPPVALTVEGKTTSPYPEASFGYLKISEPNVLLWALKPHDDGIEHGVVARLWNQHEGPVSFTLSVDSGRLVRARKLSHIETTVAPLELSDGMLRENLPAQRMETYAFDLEFPKR